LLLDIPVVSLACCNTIRPGGDDNDVTVKKQYPASLSNEH
jgi:hypothetical protein